MWPPRSQVETGFEKGWSQGAHKREALRNAGEKKTVLRTDGELVRTLTTGAANERSL